jgi:hypothetical protein
MADDLLQEVVEGGFYGRGGRGSFLLGGHLAGGQTKIQRNDDAFARGVLLDESLEMNEFGAKGLQAFSQFFHLLVYFFFNVRSFADFISNMNVHESLGNRE